MTEYATTARIATPAASETDLAARIVSLVGSRLCHDLISPLGAIGNGVELLQMAGEWPGLQKSPEMSLIEDALHAARARITCFRIAFGATGGAQRVSPAELAALIADVERAGRMRVTLDAPGDHGRGHVKLMMLALMCLETAMPWGARITIRQQGRDWTVSADAERTRHDPALWAWLDGPRPGQPEPAASEVHFPLLGLAAAEMDRRIRWSLTETGAEIRF
ncbi:histidine phosphotransferase family protein [Paracoccus xiamenensis]|uniref:histidine phosphotransferase family protein n=1 Tax=Paracoccus xiamenensis TaxID=2714901 RepID=UPI00140780BA|nr:histidine phosphotransferase family protein [Paracoccus xiamenensis]NHF71895.1 histidine phosphotransferase [Paracoccus xiamenensis]